MIYFQCEICGEKFSRKSNLTRHRKQEHLGIQVKKYSCSEINQHIDCSLNLPCVTKDGFTRIITKTAFNGLVRHIRFYKEDNVSILPWDFIINANTLLNETINILRKEPLQVKIQCVLCVQFKKINTFPLKTDESYFSYPIQILDEDFCLETILSIIINKIQSFTRRGSSWVLNTTKFLEKCVTRIDKKQNNEES